VNAAILITLTCLITPQEATPAIVDRATVEAEPAVRAMRDELARSVARLRLDNAEPPFIVAYTLGDSGNWSCSASFGALSSEGGDDSSRSMGVEVRVGDYSLDNTNFVGGFGFGGSRGRIGLPDDDDYDATRHRIWLATDQLYKGAVEQIAAKRAWLKTNSVPDRPDDLSRVEPTLHLEAVRELKVDKEAGRETVKRLSALFRQAPRIESSSASIVVVAINETLLSSEGSLTRTGTAWTRVTVTAQAQAEDGMPLGDLCVFYAASQDELPAIEAMEAEVRTMIARLEARVSAPRAEEYIGPILLEGEAAAFAMLELFVDRVSNPHEPLGARNAGTAFKNRLKKRVAPPFLDIVDDPTQRAYEGVPLLGAYAVDDDGVKPQVVELIDEGRLKSWYMSRIPTREIKETNGHSRGGVGGPGCVFVKSRETKTRDELRAELIRIAVEQELPYAIRVESLARSDVGVSGPRAAGGFTGGNIRLSPPIAAYRVYPDGREEPIRGGEWQGVTLRTLRDIFLTSDRPHVLNTLRGGNFVSIVCPDLLVEEIEMKKPADQESKRPYLPHPFFASE
jgi:TldD protein